MRQFFNLKSNFYFLQKLVFAIFCFALGFLFGSGMLKVEAKIANDGQYNKFLYTTQYVDYQNVSYQDQVNRIIELVKSIKKNYAIVVNYAKDSGSDFLYNRYLRIYLFDDDVNLKGTSTLTFDSENIYQLQLKSGASSFPSYWNGTLYTIDDLETALNTNNYNLVKTNYAVAYDLNHTNGSGVVFTSDVVYSSNVEFKNIFDYSLYFNDVEIKPNQKIPIAYDFSKIIYTENYRLSTKDVKQIEYTFDFSNNLNENNMFFHEFNFSTSLTLENATFDIFDYPYLQYTKDGITYELPLNLKTDETGNQLMYFDTQINSFQNIQDLKFIVPTEKLMDIEADMYIHFDSSLNFAKKVYTKEEIIPPLQFYNVYNVNDIDHIEVEFDLNNVPEDAIISNEPDFFKFRMNYDIKITTDSRGHNLASDLTLDIPRIEYMKVGSDGILNTSTYGLSNNRINHYDKYFGNEEYTNTYLVNYDYNRTLKLIINCRDINDVFLNLKISSTLDYKINIFYRENVEDYRKYYQTIDITGKYAVVFIPKIRLDGNENSVSSYFISNGKFRVEERDTYLKEFTLYKDPTEVLGINQYYYFYGLSGELHKNDSIYYKNLNYPGLEEATIQYDSRYFVVSLCENDYTCQTVINPNTGEEITPDSSPNDSEWSINNIFKIVDDFLNQVRDTGDYFNECFNAFWEKVPIILQSIIVFIYIMLHIIVFVRIGGWSND